MNEKLVLDLYAKISATTSQMLAAAQEQDWDLLCDLEASCSDYTEKLKAINMNPTFNQMMQNKKMGYIQEILENDRKIREIVSPWMQRLNGLINHNSTERKLTRAYHP